MRNPAEGGTKAKNVPVVLLYIHLFCCSYLMNIKHYICIKEGGREGEKEEGTYRPCASFLSAAAI